MGAAIALWRGPRHVLIWANPAFMEKVPRDGRGVPVREAFIEPRYEPFIQALDACWEARGVIRLPVPPGILYLCPRRDQRGRMIGVASWYGDVPAPPEALPPRSPLEQSTELVSFAQ